MEARQKLKEDLTNALLQMREIITLCKEPTDDKAINNVWGGISSLLKEVEKI